VSKGQRAVGRKQLVVESEQWTTDTKYYAVDSKQWALNSVTVDSWQQTVGSVEVRLSKEFSHALLTISVTSRRTLISSYIVSSSNFGERNLFAISFFVEININFVILIRAK
jgi:hypothetical protein